MNVTAWNEILEDGETCVGAVIEYDRDVDPGSLQSDTFGAEGRTLVRAYVSDQRKRDYFGRNHTGRYIFLDFALTDENAVLVDSVPGPVAHQKHPIGCSVRQAKALRGADGSILPPWPEALPVEDSTPEVLYRYQKSDYVDPENGARLTNFLYVPEDYDPSSKIPVILYFHKGPDKGSDGYHLISCHGGSIWASANEQLVRRCIVIAPQCPPEGDWTDPDTYQLTDYFFAVCHILFDVIRRYNVDRERICCVGASMGGMGAWEINKRFPHLFASSIICVGQCNYEGVEILKDCNIWALHGENDPKSMTGVTDIIDDIQCAGGHVCRAFWDGQLRGEPAEQLALEDGVYTYSDEPYPVPLLSLDNESHYRMGEEAGTAYVNNAVLESAADGYHTFFAGSAHINFTDLPLLSPALASLLGESGVGDVDPEACVRQLDALALQFFDCYLKGEGTMDSLEPRYF